MPKADRPENICMYESKVERVRLTGPPKLILQGFSASRRHCSWSPISPAMTYVRSRLGAYRIYGVQVADNYEVTISPAPLLRLKDRRQRRSHIQIYYKIRSSMRQLPRLLPCPYSVQTVGGSFYTHRPPTDLLHQRRSI